MNDGVETFEVLATVIVVVPEFHQGILRTPNEERQLVISRHTAGLSLSDVREGQVYLLTVTRRFARLLYALATERYAAGKASVVRPTTKAPEQIAPETYRPAATLIAGRTRL